MVVRTACQAARPAAPRLRRWNFFPAQFSRFYVQIAKIAIFGPIFGPKKWRQILTFEYFRSLLRLNLLDLGGDRLAQTVFEMGIGKGSKKIRLEDLDALGRVSRLFRRLRRLALGRRTPGRAIPRRWS